MFGNVRGWILSALIAAFVAFIIYNRGLPATISPPSGRLPQGLQPADLPTAPKEVLPAAGSKECDAGDLYRQAGLDYEKNKRAYDEFDKMKADPKDPAYADKRRQRADLGAQLPGVKLVLEAADCKKTTLFAKRVTDVVNYDNSKPVLPGLQALGRISVTVAALYGAPFPGPDGKTPQPALDPAKGKQFLNATFLLGERLYDERVVFDEYRIGCEVMVNAAGQMRQWGTDKSDKARLDLLQKFIDDEASSSGTKLKPLWVALSGIGADRNGRLLYAGDMFAIAQSNTADPMWRTEALLKLGRMKFMQEVGYGDQTGANRTLRKMADRVDLPPNVKAAAAAGRDLDVLKFRMYGGGT